MASNYPQQSPHPKRNLYLLISIVSLAVVAVCITVVAVLMFRSQKPDVPAVREDAYLDALRARVELLREDMPSYLMGIPEYEAGLLSVQDGKLYYGDNSTYVFSDDGASNEAAPFEESRLTRFEADEDALIDDLMTLIETPEVAQLLQDERYFGDSFDDKHPEASLWLRLSDGQEYYVNQTHMLIDLNACQTVLDAAEEYANTYEGDGSPWST